MPSLLAQVPPSKVTAVTARTSVDLPFRSPFAGYVPDLAQVFRGGTGLIACKAIGVIGGRLVLLDGWRKLDSVPTSLALGHNGDVNAFTDSGGGDYGAGAAPTVTGGNDIQQPVMHLAAFQRFTVANGLGNLEALAITADTDTILDGGGVAPFQETGHLYRKPGPANTWSSVEFRSRDSAGAGAVVPGAVPLTGTVNDWIDSAIYTPGVPGGTYTDPDTAVVHTVRAVAEATFIFTNYVDSVFYYPDVTDATNYTDFTSYVFQLTQLGTQMITTTAQGFYSPPTFETLKCQSLASFGGRMFYFNTVEGDDHFASRLRWSILGNPFIVWPSFEITQTVGGSLHFDGVGSGHFDLDQFRTEGQRCEPLGDVLACYSKDGIAFARRTGIPTDAISIEYVTLDRGVLTPGSVCAINAAQHFAILSDGWYIVNANGVLQELGQVPEQRTQLGGGTGRSYKWKQDFYRRLDFAEVNQGRLITEYEPATKLVRIVAPMLGGNSEIWNYDVQNDRVFLDDYRSIGGVDQTPRSLGLLPSFTPGLTWDDPPVGVDWDTGFPGRSWDSFSGTSFRELTLAHGDTSGFVYSHDTQLSTRDGSIADWNWRTATRALGDNPDSTIVVDGVTATFDNLEGVGSATTTIEVVGYSERFDTTSAAYIETRTLDMTRGDSGQMAVDDIGFRVPGDNHQIAMSGTGAVSLHELRLRVVVEGSTHRRMEGT